MTNDQEDALDAWINAGPCRCVVYAGDGMWWPAEETHDGPQKCVDFDIELTIEGLVEWCRVNV